MIEREILEKYSTPGLRKFEITRAVKKEQLSNPRYGMTAAEIEATLDRLYAKED